MKLTKSNVEKISNESDLNLVKEVCDFIIERWDDYDDKKLIITEVLNYGCANGAVPKLIYISQTSAFYRMYRNEINDLLYNAMEEYGIYDIGLLFSNWDKEDPLAFYGYNQNILAWFGFEETMRNIAYNFEELADEI